MNDLAAIDAAENHLAGLTEKQTRFVSLMVMGGLKVSKAAQQAGMSERQAYNLMHKPEIRAALRAEEQVLRMSLRPQALHALRKVTNSGRLDTAQVNAATRLLDDRPGQTNISVQVGVQVGYIIDVSPEPVGSVTPQPTRHGPVLDLPAVEATPPSSQAPVGEGRPPKTGARGPASKAPHTTSGPKRGRSDGSEIAASRAGAREGENFLPPENPGGRRGRWHFVPDDEGGDE